MKSKTIILSSNKKFVSNSPRAIITFIDENKSTDGKLRLYNMPKLSPSVKLGVYYNQKVYSSTLSDKDGAYNFFIDEKFDLNQNIYCALIDTNNKNEVVLSGGSGDGFYFTDEEDCIEDSESDEEISMSQKPSNKEKVNSNKNIDEKNEVNHNENLSQNKTFSLDKEEEELIDACINADDEFNNISPAINFECEDGSLKKESCSNCDCKDCVYKAYFYAQVGEEKEDKTSNQTSISTNEQNSYIEKKDKNLKNNDDLINDELNGVEKTRFDEKTPELNDNFTEPTSQNNDKLSFQNDDKPSSNKNQQCKEIKDNYNPNEQHSAESFIPIYNSNNENYNEYNLKNENDDCTDNLIKKENDEENVTATIETTSTPDNKDTASESFLNNITEQLDEMFKTYPTDEQIMKIIPNSKIVRVTDSLDNSSYIVGVIYENDEIAYLLYGVPSKYNEKAPAEFGENYQWLPINPDDPMSDGYFLLYQDASNGKLVPIKVE